jgi:hypothetical protein
MKHAHISKTVETLLLARARVETGDYCASSALWFSDGRLIGEPYAMLMTARPSPWTSIVAHHDACGMAASLSVYDRAINAAL